MKVAKLGATWIAFILAACTGPSPVESRDQQPDRTDVPSSEGQSDRPSASFKREVREADGTPFRPGSPAWEQSLRDIQGDGDGWMKRQPRGLFRGFEGPLPKAKAAMVIDAFESEAERRLEKVDWVRIESREADAFVGRKLSIGPDEFTVLLRGVTREDTPGFWHGDDRLRVMRKDGAVLVLQACARSGDYPNPQIVRRAVVAVLSGEPKEVYPDNVVSFRGGVPPPR